MPFPQGSDPKQRFDSTRRALLSVNKAELHDIEEKLKAVQTELQRRRKPSVKK
jgi:hypothetical protein